VIEINLLPGARRRRAARGAGFRLPDFETLAASVKDPWLIACVAAWTIALVVIAAFYVPKRSLVGRLVPQLDSMQREARRLQEVLATKAEAEAKRDSLLFQINVIREIDRERYIWPHILDEVTKAVPQYTWLDELTARASEPEAQAGGALGFQLSGKSADVQAITRFVRNLEESPFLQRVTLVSTAVASEEGRDVYTYIVNVEYQQPDSTRLTMQPLASSLVQSYRSGAARGR
jgi:Tfp pilus assembly protein PilN